MSWEDLRFRNLLLPENLDSVRREFANDGVIFGWHYYYAGGRSGDMFCFSDYESYYRELSQSRPGDHFIVYSRTILVNRAILRIGDVTSNQPISGVSGLADVQSALSAGKEVVYLWCHKLAETGRVECDAGILWDLTEQELHENLKLDPGRPGELLFFLLEMLDEDEQGVPIQSVSPGTARRVNAVVDGKRPNEAGLTPASGPY
jgi:hypothetical protein